MIHSNDRSGFIGASDSSFVVGNWETESFCRWWQDKLGINCRPKFQSRYTLAGTYYEHAILDTIPLCEKDVQIILPEIGLRVNYDGMVGKSVKEVKTHKAENEFKVTKGYWRQAQVEMFAADTDELEILAYPLTEEHYKNYFLEIDRTKIRAFPVTYDEAWVESMYLPRLIYLKHCMDVGAFPRKEGYIRWREERAGELKQQISRLRSSRKSSCVIMAGVLSAAI